MHFCCIFMQSAAAVVCIKYNFIIAKNRPVWAVIYIILILYNYKQQLIPLFLAYLCDFLAVLTKNRGVFVPE